MYDHPFAAVILIGSNTPKLVEDRALERLQLGCSSGGNTAGQPFDNGCYAK